MVLLPVECETAEEEASALEMERNELEIARGELLGCACTYIRAYMVRGLAWLRETGSNQ